MKRARPPTAASTSGASTGTKRPKAMRACAACKRQKARCELEDELARGQACHRCSVLGQVCSFEEEVGPPHPGPTTGFAAPEMLYVSRASSSSAPSPSAIDTTSLAARVAHIEAILAQNNLSLTQPSPSAASTLSPATTHHAAPPPAQPAAEPDEDLSFFNQAHDRGTLRVWANPPSFARAIIGAGKVPELGDPVVEGIIGEREAQEALDVFTAVYIPVLPPFPPDLSLTSSPFLHTVLLYTTFTSPHAPHTLPLSTLRRLESLLSSHLTRAVLNTRPSYATIAALLTVALFVALPDEHSLGPHAIDPLVLVRAASACAGAMGLDCAGETVVSLKDDGIEGAWMDEERDKARLFYTIAHLDLSLTMFHAPLARTPSFPFPPTESVFSSHQPTPLVDRRLVLEGRLLSAASSVAVAIQRVERCRFVAQSIDKALEALEGFSSFLDSWRAELQALRDVLPERAPHPALDVLSLDSHLAHIVLSLRLSNAIRLLPSPLLPSIREKPFCLAGATLIRANAQVLRVALSVDLARASLHHTTTLVLCIAMLLNVCALGRRNGYTLPLTDGWMVDVDRLLVRMADLGEWPGRCARKVWAQRDWEDAKSGEPVRLGSMPVENEPRHPPHPHAPQHTQQHNHDPYGLQSLHDPTVGPPPGQDYGWAAAGAMGMPPEMGDGMAGMRDPAAMAMFWPMLFGMDPQAQGGVQGGVPTMS